MPTIVTHAAVGAALAPLGPRALSRGRLGFALGVLSVLPDLDVVAFYFDVAYSHWLGHRGVSHSLLFAVLVAAAVVRFGFRQVPLAARERWAVFGLCAVAIASHGMLDAFTDGGLGIAFFFPFSADRYFFPYQPLAVSPIGASRFVRGPGLAVLASEAVCVWAPLAAVLVASRVIRSRSRRRSTR